jgi:hypothetical protein
VLADSVTGDSSGARASKSWTRSIRAAMPAILSLHRVTPSNIRARARMGAPGEVNLVRTKAGARTRRAKVVIVPFAGGELAPGPPPAAGAT